MQTFGFTCGYSGPVVLDEAFSVPGSTYPVVSTYIVMPSTGTEGGVVYQNSAGQIMYFPYAVLGYNPIAATMILSSATVDGTPRTTTATPLGWLGSVNQ